MAKTDKYQHIVKVTTEDGMFYANERNGVVIVTDECAKRYTEERAHEVRNTLLALRPGHGDEYGCRVSKVRKRTRGTYRALVRAREVERRDMLAEFAEWERAMKGAMQ